MPKRASAPSRRLALTGIVLIAVTVVAAAVSIIERYQEAIERNRQELSKLSAVLAEQTARSLQSIDLVLQEIQAKGPTLATEPEQLRLQLSSPALHDFLTERSNVLPQVKAIGLVAADGTLVNGSGSRFPANANLSGRDYFTYLREHDVQDVYISAPTRTIEGYWTFFLARRINNRGGAFGGVAVALADSDYFDGFYRAISPEEGDSVVLLDRDGTVLVRYPRIEDAVGKRMPAQSHWYETIARGGGTYRAPGYLGGVPRIVSAHLVPGYPLAVNATVSEEAALAAWRKGAVLIVAVALGAVIGYALLFRALAARSRRLERQTARLAEIAEALRNSEARFRDFATITSDWLWESDADHRFTYISDSARRFGVDPTAILGRTRAEVAVAFDRDRAKWDQHIATLDRHEPFRDFVYSHTAAGITPEKIASINGNPVFDASGAFRGFRGTARDVTEQALSERRLRDAKLAAEAANIAKSQFLANISHELRTPLNAIIGFSDMMVSGLAGSLNAKQDEYGRIINSSGKHLLHIVNDLLDIAKIDAGKFTLQNEEVEPKRFADSCLDMVRETAQRHEVELSAEVEPGLPNFFADARRLKQVMLNLLSNAIKFTGAGGSVVLRIRGQGGADVVFEVEDTGLGMTPEEVRVALEPFGQVDAGLNRRHDGAGLGLPLARSLVEQHGGAFRIDSEKGRGTKISVSLPARRPAAGDPQPEAAAAA